MKALGVLGTSSSAGKSWMTTALCAWLRGQGVRVAPFKAQNMSNNASVTVEGGEMARAQVVQAEACGLRPTVEMNPILLKPSGAQGSQVVVLGRAQQHRSGRDYYRDFARHWQIVADTLDGWKNRCDVLVLEGAGSPVELNLMDRDLVNLRPLRHLDGRWLLVGDIDRGGIYAQLAGTWALLPPEDRARGLGAIVNRFRGDLGLFPDPAQWLAPHALGLPVLGTVPLRPDLQPEEEDGLAPADEDRGTGDTIAWVRCPHAANLTDCQPWWDDAGVRTLWTADPAALAAARIIVIPGTKNTLADLRWLRARGLDQVIAAAARRGTLVLGVCGGYQMLGERLLDPTGVAGDAGDEPGLGLLPVTTHFEPTKIVRQVTAECAGQRWAAYEIHMGRTAATAPVEALQAVQDTDGTSRPEGVRRGNVWGTYLHGWFEAPALRAHVAAAGGLAAHRAHPQPWSERRRALYAAMAAHVAAHVNLDPVRRYLGL
jgi:adenosylcobyric acid synthase